MITPTRSVQYALKIDVVLVMEHERLERAYLPNSECERGPLEVCPPDGGKVSFSMGSYLPIETSALLTSSIDLPYSSTNGG